MHIDPKRQGDFMHIYMYAHTGVCETNLDPDVHRDRFDSDGCHTPSHTVGHGQGKKALSYRDVHRMKQYTPARHMHAFIKLYPISYKW